MNIVLDTNAVLYFLGGRLRDPLPQAHLYISVITEIELLSYPLLSSENESEIYGFLDDVTIVDLSTAIKQETIKLRRQYRFKLPDAIIVATARHLKAELLTNDIKLLKMSEVSVRALQLKDENQ
ncbi:MAG: type II toxin-antitoxin system VapC family toxin [Methylococcaceae bacterium]